MQIGKIKTINIVILFFSLFFSLAVFSQISVANLKPTSDVGLNKADWLYFKSSNDLSAYLGKKSSNLPTVRYQKNNDYLEFSLNNVSSTTSVSLETNSKTPNTPTLFYRNVLQDIDVNYQITNIPFKVKEEIILLKPTSLVGGQANLKFIFNAETTGKPSKQKDGSIAFFGDNGEYLFQLDKPFMVDAGGNRSEEVDMQIKEIKKEKDKAFDFQSKNLNLNFISKYLKLPTFKPSNRHPMSVLGPQRYIITLSASSAWLNDTARVYPVIIDPTVTHNADANFTGQMNRIADSDTTSSTQLESSYPEATKDPYTVLLLHFNEANGTTAGIRDYASTTRVITANGNASTTSYVTQLGLGNSAAFDGNDELSMVNSSDFYLGGNNFTLQSWFYSTSTVVGTDYIMHMGGNLSDWAFAIDATSGLGFRHYSGGWNDYYVSWSPAINTWYLLTIVRTGNTLLYYVNGTQIGSNSFSATIADHDLLMSVGAYNNSGSNGINGYLDSLRIIKGRALTPEEIKAAASRRPYAVYTSPVVDAAASVAWNTVNWTEGGVNTGNGETLYNTSGLVAQWDFNETSGTNATSSTNGSCVTCAGTLTNFASTASQDQAAGTGWTANNKKWGAGALMMESAAAADYVSIADPASNVLDPNSADLTIETWIKTSDISAEIFSNNNANGTACTNNGYYLGVDASGYPVFYLDTNGATAGCDASTTSQFKINDGNWHKIAVSVTRGTSAVIYVDGKSAGSDTSVTSYSTITVTGNAYFGGSAGGLDAIIDSARIYSRALSASEILSNYNAGNIEIQTRTGATSDPNDGTWEAWKPTTGETQLFSLDSDAVNWHSDIMASTTIATSTETVIKAEGTGSLKIRTGMASTTAGTVALWHFEETGTTTGTTLYDSTANANNATTTGTTVVDGIFGKGRKFNGTSDVVNAADSANWAFGTGDFSIDFWVKMPDTTPPAHVQFFGQNADPTFATNRTLFKLNTGGDLQYQVLDSGGVNTILFESAVNILSENTWHYVALTRRGNNFNIYVDTNSVASATDTDSVPDYAAPAIIGYFPVTGGYLNGSLDEFRILKGRALSSDEIAETYRMGANHHLTRQVSATDLSGANKLAFNVAADRPGTYLEAMLGESDYANYELASSTLALSTNTVLYIKGDEIASSTSIKDSSFSGKAITANGNARTAGGGKIGNSLIFDGTGDYLSVPDSDDWTFGTGNFSIDFWVKFNNVAEASLIAHGGRGTLADYEGIIIQLSASGVLFFSSIPPSLTADITFSLPWSPSANTWYQVALVRNGTSFYFFINGSQRGSLVDADSITNPSYNLYLGRMEDNTSYLNGYIDEVRVLKGTALTPDQIRQAYEYGLRTHPITIDFGATLQPSDLISSATDYNFSLTATTSGLSATTSGLYLGDKIIIKENLGGTEYAAQGTVNAINTTTGAITVPSWDTGSTFPSGNGYSPNASVFKWQREYFDITGSLSTHRDAITNLTLRPTNGAEGRTIYLDDFRYNTNYLTASSSSAITSGNNRYLQYRAIFTSWDTFVSPYLTAFNTLYTALANSFPAIIGVSGGGFLSF